MIDHGDRCGGGSGLFQFHNFAYKNIIPNQVRIPIYIVIIAAFVTIADLYQLLWYLML